MRRMTLPFRIAPLIFALAGCAPHAHPHAECASDKKASSDGSTHSTAEAPLADTHEHSHGDGEQPHTHPERSPIAEQSGSSDAPSPEPREARVISHEQVKAFGNNGNELKGIATKAQGAESYEVWRTSVAVGSQTPLHSHESEEVFIFLRGKGKAVIGGKEFTFEAPATVIAPAGVKHQFFNTGDVPTDAVVVVGIGSTIYDGNGKPMNLPWRK